MTETNNINTVVAEILRGAKQVSGEVYAASKETLSASIDYIQKEMPELAEQYLKWEFTSACINATMFVIVIGCIIYAMHWIYKKMFSDDTFEAGFPLCFVAMVFLVPVSLGFYHNLNKAVKIVVAPKVFLIENVGEKLGFFKK